MYYVSKFQGFENFKPRYVLTIKYIWKSKETRKLLLNVRIILSFNKSEPSQKQQFVNDFIRNLCETTEFEFLCFTSSFKSYG